MFGDDLLESIKVTNFQSLQNVEVELGKFTVIVGASSSGKSALTRAIKAVASNKLDSDYITRGTKVSAVSIKTNDNTITIERESGGSSAYKIAQAGGEESRFARINRQVPAEVTKALGIVPETKEVASINFAGQFDTPYLLKEGASSVARVLGELTNVSTIFAAVKEASRRGKNASGLVNLRKKDQEKLIAEISSYANIGAQAKAVSEAERMLEHCIELQTQVAELNELRLRLEKATNTLNSIQSIPELPQIDALELAEQELRTFKMLVRQFVSAKKQVAESSTSIDQANSDILLAEEQLHQLLVDAGQCPTCHQVIPSER